MAIIEPGQKLLIVHRRLYPSDMPRYFTGTVEGYEAGIVVIKGHTWEKDQLAGSILRKRDARTKIIPLSSGGYLAYRLADDVDIDALRVESGTDDAVWLTDGKAFRMDITERVAPGTHTV